ncbi:precorrin-6y C5,15-methyltransferase (decarboxylating) subunit CbiE [Pararhizobium mangrovi]|uniref:Precorrin-6y C5,15-methyltransferase (Decarboxylating) subunit CbiE n=1 Tax=Pararhizobium mangrovi TaxID=2590452 RepID=A0A506UDT1_9HYPH|nr:precorrin-6y C5,15-methyltransferase (decarboxylating) subunit CbiE [Pararhizobium mangrovi]TPW31291.1 precorrin-6y C5,15-methyltransferase (decarboxylating) subunit CbiE [Pararhizobium mangrovi]
MSAPWLNIVGIGEDGMEGLSPAARALVESAEVIVGGDRHHRLSANVTAQRVAWPSPFDAMIETICSFRGRRIVVLVTGDPLWYSVGARIARAIPPAEIRFHPQLSAFQFAACRMGWSLADCETLTIHGRPAEQIVPFFEPDARLLVLTRDGRSPTSVARLLVERGYGKSKLTVLASLGGAQERRIEGTAEGWDQSVPDFHTLAVECVAGAHATILPRTGLPDAGFRHDGKMTKQGVRALVLAKLAPVRGGVLWDIGAGCGSVGIEWMRAAREARAIGIEPKPERRALAAENALALGTPALELVDGTAPEALGELRQPDAVFIGGGLDASVVDAAIDALKSHGRLVANAVTLESETILLAMAGQHGGELTRLNIAHAEAIGSLHGWRPAMPVTMWSWRKGVA